MTLDVTISEQPNDIKVEIPLIERMSVNISSISLICNYVKSYRGEWCKQAIRDANDEIGSDEKELIEFAKKEISKAKKSIPFKYKYLINPIKLWRQKLK